MAVPSFDEILEQARKYQSDKADIERDTMRGSAIASSLSNLFKETLLTDTGKRESYSGEVNPSGDYRSYSNPIEKGLPIAETGFKRLFGINSQDQVSSNSIPLTREEAVDYRLKRTLIGDKSNAQLAYLKDKIKLENQYNPKPKNPESPMTKEENALFYIEAYPGLTMEEALLKEPITYAGASRIAAIRGMSLKSMGIDYSVGKDIIGQTDPALIEEQNKMEQERLAQVRKTNPGAGGGNLLKNPNEVERVTPDKRIAIFDAKTKAFLRYKK